MASPLRLLGTPQRQLDGRWTPLPPGRPLLLLSYLAYQEDWVSRDELLALLWPDIAEKPARQNLRQLLYQCRQEPWAEGLEVERTRLRWPVATDVARFREALGAGDWPVALEACQGELLEAVRIDLPPPFEEWLAAEREVLQGAWREAALAHAATLEARAEYGQGAALLRQVLRQDPLAEDALRAFMRCAYLDGQRDQALRSFDAFAAQLQREFEMEPLEETVELAGAVREGTLTRPQPIPAGHSTTPERPQASATPPAPATAPRLMNVPSQLTPFIGRDLDLAAIANLLQTPEVRLVTLAGPGGNGKTRLAIQTLLEQVGVFPDGAAFVPLAAITRPDQIPVVAATALGLAFGPDGNASGQLTDYLRDRNLLLAVDNVEHVIDGATLLLELLEAAPGLKLLVTSREALGFQSEWFYEVKGMEVPAESDEQPELHDGVELFLRRARSVQPQLVLGEGDRARVGRICRLVGGSPLGIELAANWVRILSLEQILAELGDSLDLLESDQRDLPERHRSIRGGVRRVMGTPRRIRAVGHPEALRVSRRLLQGTRLARWPGTSVRTLLSLANKSLIYRNARDRFERHPLIWQFVQGEGRGRPGAVAHRRGSGAPRELPSAASLAERWSRLTGSDQRAALDEISTELENVRAAWPLGWRQRGGRAARPGGRRLRNGS